MGEIGEGKKVEKNYAAMLRCGKWRIWVLRSCWFAELAFGSQEHLLARGDFELAARNLRVDTCIEALVSSRDSGRSMLRIATQRDGNLCGLAVPQD